MKVSLFEFSMARDAWIRKRVFEIEDGTKVEEIIKKNREVDLFYRFDFDGKPSFCFNSKPIFI